VAVVGIRHEFRTSSGWRVRCLWLQGRPWSESGGCHGSCPGRSGGRGHVRGPRPVECSRAGLDGSCGGAVTRALLVSVRRRGVVPGCGWVSGSPRSTDFGCGDGGMRVHDRRCGPGGLLTYLAALRSWARRLASRTDRQPVAGVDEAALVFALTLSPHSTRASPARSNAVYSNDAPASHVLTPNVVQQPWRPPSGAASGRRSGWRRSSGEERLCWSRCRCGAGTVLALIPGRVRAWRGACVKDVDAAAGQAGDARPTTRSGASQPSLPWMPRSTRRPNCGRS